MPKPPSKHWANLNDLMRQISGRRPNVHELAAFGSYVRDVYQGFENMLLRLIKFHGVARPDGSDWHLTVFKLFSSPGTPPLPMLITQDLAVQIGKYRGFRHVFNKPYSAFLDWDKLEPLVNDLEPTYHALYNSIENHVAGLG